ncbi:DUF1992 domain-containing protein [Evansella sp. LMS18]|uniref:DnaJ family domain-containing protein n=1 Tax=Evansella sp. LMS18 TaxID=2924033 RepID=UPI0020D1CB32|nr:DnaJ family domain-containing protein [Evansella sp. LMS18]UTR10026.1 DUF1992 domain-containing protein [Evansella sp. LMS18]
MDREYNDLIGDILKDKGEKDNFKGEGKGKPLKKEYMELDVYQNFQRVAKDAGFLPPWLKLQKEISELIYICKTEKELKAINKKIKKYNSICPSSFQKNFVTMENLEKAKKLW